MLRPNRTELRRPEIDQQPQRQPRPPNRLVVPKAVDQAPGDRNQFFCLACVCAARNSVAMAREARG